MKKNKNTISILGLVLISALLVLPACKSKKMVVQPAAPAPAPVVEAPKAPPVEVDTDKDGIVDSKDKCPDVAGIAANDGCPEVKAPEPKFAYSNLQFEFNSSVLKTSNYEILDQIARELKAYPTVSISINGHASEEGTVERNMTLSLDRATAVKTYLVNAGVKAENLITKGFGESSPIASNATEAGRELNRRVEFKKN